MRNGWSNYNPACIQCGTTAKSHKGLGLCTTCYYRQYRRPNPARPNEGKSEEKAFQEGVEHAIAVVNSILKSKGGHCTIVSGSVYLAVGLGSKAQHAKL